MATKASNSGVGLGSFLRIFTFSDRLSWTLNTLGLIAAIGSGITLALVNVILGGFVTTVQNFLEGGSSEVFRQESSQYALYFVYLGIARLGLSYIFLTCFTISATRITNNIRYQFLKATLRQDIGYFDRHDIGSAAAQVVTNGNMIQQGIAEKLALSIQALSTFVAAFVVAFIRQARLTGITLSIVPAMLITIGVTALIDTRYEQNMLAIYARAGSFAEDAIASLRTVHAFGARSKLVKRFDKFLEAAHMIGRGKSPLYMFLFSMEFFIEYSGFALCFWQGIRMYNSGEITTPGTIMTVLFSVIIAAVSLTSIAPNFIVFSSATSAASALFQTIDRKSLIDALSETGLKPETLKGAIHLKEVEFSYPTRPDTKVLSQFSLQIPAGKTTALVGASGSGKSTIVGLLERWYNPASGSIVLDDTPINSLNLRWLRTKVRLVQQEPVLFMGSVFDNVRYGLVGTEWESAPIEVQRRMIEDACRIANAHQFVSDLPHGYDSQCGEGASLLSGGQKQRIAIARSIISKPSVLLLDEATSALDPESEGIVQAALDNAAVGRTTIVIAHKLATIKNADNIVVMEKGKIIEQGTHAELLQGDGAYARLVKIQDLGTQLPPEPSDAEDEEHSLALNKTATMLSEKAVLGLKKDQDDDNYEVYKGAGMLSMIWRILREQSGMKMTYIFAALSCIVGGFQFLGMALLFSRIITVFGLPTAAERSSEGNFYSLMFFIFALGTLIIYAVMGWTMNLIVQKISRTYRRQLFDTILSQDVRFFDRPENTVGALSSRLSSYPQAVTELMGFNLGFIAIAVVNLLSASVLAIVYAWRLGLVVVLAGLPPLVLSGLIKIKLDQKLDDKNTKLYASSASVAGESVSAIRTVSSLALEPTVLKNFQSQLQEAIQTGSRQVLFLMGFSAMTFAIEFFFLALAFWYGCYLLSQNEFSVQSFYVAVIGTFFSGQAAAQFFSFGTSITKAAGASKYIFWIRSLKPRIVETADNKDQGPSKQPAIVDLNKVKFAYPTRPQIPVLKGINLEIKPGQFVAFVGPSGCGKSTMIAMLERYYDPVRGIISLGGRPLPTMSPRLYRRLIGLVQQEPALYEGSILDNILLGLESEAGVSHDAVIEACKQANAWEFIASLPEGLETHCTSRGKNFSGGQRQRVAIARALIRDPDILLLDEATSALDTNSEKIVQNALDDARAKKNRIMVAVAHRLSTIKHADTIFVFSSGRIVEAGSHRDLLAQGGVYAKMCEAQRLEG